MQFEDPRRAIGPFDDTAGLSKDRVDVTALCLGKRDEG
jgi:hypothetical protein